MKGDVEKKIDQLGRRERTKLALKLRLIQSATKALSVKPLEEVTVEELCETADITRKTFYNHYSTKQDLIEVISQTLLMAESDRNFALAMKKFSTTKDRLVYFLQQQGKNLADKPQLKRNLVKHAMLDLSINNERSKAKLEQNITIFENMFNEGLRIGDVKKTYSTRFLAEMVAGAVNTSAIHWIHLPDYPANERFEELIRFIQDMIILDTEC